MILFDGDFYLKEDVIVSVYSGDDYLYCSTMRGISDKQVFCKTAEEAIFARDWLIAILDDHKQVEPMAIIRQLTDILIRVMDKLDDAEDIIDALASDGVQVGHA